MNKQQMGMTLIELMVSLVLSLGLIAGVCSLFIHMQVSNNVQRAFNTMSDDASYAQSVLQKELRRTGGLAAPSSTSGSANLIFLGPTNHNSEFGDTNITFQNSEYIQGDATVAANSDAFILRYQLVDANDLSATAAASSSNSPCTQNVLLNDPNAANPVMNPVLTREDPAVVPHVVSIFFQLAATPTASNPSMQTLTCVAQRTAQGQVSGVGAAQVEVSSTETCIRNCTSATNFTRFDSTTIPLIPNVVALGIKYGVDTDEDNAPNFYVTAANVPSTAAAILNGYCPSVSNDCWQDIVSVRLALVVASANDFLVKTPMQYQFEGATVTPTDHRLYKSFTTTIDLRNE